MIDVSAARAELESPPIMEGVQTDRSLSDSVFAPIREKNGRGWWMMFLTCLGLTGLLALSIAYTLVVGIGAWGNNIPVGWGFEIVNFVWWIGIGHAGTLISAILLLLQQEWRTSINRFAEAMTLFAVMCAGLYPLLHTGRPWHDYWLFPYPATMQLWPNFRSPLMWDVFAISTYATVSMLFWYLGLIPDLAALRDSSKTRAQRIAYGIFALGWRGAAHQWKDYRWAYTLLAGMSAPLVLSVHTIVSFDFAVSLLPGWHTTIFPPYFVAGAVYSGFAMVLTLLIPARKFMHFKHIVTLRHLENMAKVLLATGWMVTFGYFVEGFTAWYSGDVNEIGQLKTRFFGPYAPFYWMLIFCNCVVMQSFWWKKARTNIYWLWIAALFINVGMWLERFVIVVISLHRDFLPSSWGMYWPTWVDISMFIGTMGLFGTLFLLFLRFVPAVAAMEVKELRYEHELHAAGHGGHGETHAAGEDHDAAASNGANGHNGKAGH
jgi:Ni/Fe-hydrogenase subunit HybB-like protein